MADSDGASAIALPVLSTTEEGQQENTSSVKPGPPPKTVALHLDEFGRPTGNQNGITTLALPPENYNFHVPPAIEREHVHNIYDTIAEQWSGTRYKAWPKVESFLGTLPQNSLVADLGMGNAKNVNAGCRLRNIGFMSGMDISRNLVQCSQDRMRQMWEDESKEEVLRRAQSMQAKNSSQAGSISEDTAMREDGQQVNAGGKSQKQKGPSHTPKQRKKPPPPPPPLLTPNFDFLVADLVHTPYRGGLFDAAICIAVLHHMSTRERRIEVIRECLRVLRVGGRLLLYAWAEEQGSGDGTENGRQGVSNHDFESTGSQDCLVAWHHKLVTAEPASSVPKGITHSAGAPGSSSTAACSGAAADPSPKTDDWESGQAALKLLSHAKQLGDAGRLSSTTMTKGKESEGIQSSGYVDTEKRAVVYQRYCHVYREGELEELFHATSMCEIEEVYMDTGNWCIIARRL